MTKPIEITTLPAPRTFPLKKTLIIAGAALGLIAAGTLAVIFATSSEESDQETAE